MGWLARLLEPLRMPRTPVPDPGPLPPPPQTYTPPAPRPPRDWGRRVYQPPSLDPYLRGNPYYEQRRAERELRDTSGRLEVHHLTYDHHRDEWNHQGDLVTLCVSCHNADHVAKPWLHAPKPYPTYYQEFLATPYWNRVRREVLRRDGYRCGSCGSAGHVPAPTFSFPRSRRGALNQMIRMLEQG